MNGIPTQTVLQNTLDEERREAMESVIRGAVERPWDRITQSACSYLFRHLVREAPNKGLNGFIRVV